MSERDWPPTCPRRSRKLSEQTIKKNKSSLEVLIQMGFPKPRAEKALAATGDTGVQMASDWLLSHVNDPSLDEHCPREYILYLCPVGQLQQELIDFWHRSFQECGWNRAHNYFPHVTLCSFFQAEDSQVPLLAHMLKAAVDRFKKLPETIDLEYFSSTNFIGLFISETSSLFIKQLTADFAEEARKIGVTVEPHKKQLHISLAYQFHTDKKAVLEEVAKTINPNLPVRWDIRLYSREAKLAACQVRKVLYSHIPTDTDEIELVDGDCIFVENSEIEQSTDSWYHGVSWLTGQAGMFPGPFTERCAESEVWTMHRSIPVVGVEPNHPADSNGLLEEEDETDNTPKPPEIPPRGASIMTSSHGSMKQSKPPAKSPTRHPNTSSSNVADGQNKQSNSAASSLERGWQESHPEPRPEHRQEPPLPMMHPIQKPQPQQQQQQQQQPAQTEAVYAKVNKPNKTSHASPPPPITTASKTSSKQVSSHTISASASSSSVSTNPFEGLDSEMFVSKRTSLVMDGRKNVTPPTADSQKIGTLRGAAHNQGPRQLYVIRHGERIDFTFGKEWIKNSFNKHGNYVRYDLNMPKTMPKRKGGPQDFSKDSPLTIQGQFQARIIGLEKELPIHIEPGLFEWLGWYQTGLPCFLPEDELTERFNIDCGHETIWPVSKYNVQESTEEYYDRCHTVTKEILRRHENEGGNLILVTHASSLDCVTRQLVGQPPRSTVGFHDVMAKIPYCAMSVAQEACLVRDTWYLIEPPILPFAHTNNPKYNWTCLTSPNMI